MMKVYEVQWWESDDIQRIWFDNEDKARKFSGELKATEDYEYEIVTLIAFRVHEVPNDVKVFVEWLNSNTH